MAFRLEQHRAIAEALASMDGPWLERNGCFFGGGTAIVLQHGEYRLSADVDFLCADADGYRSLRTAASERGASAFFGGGVQTLREFRIDQYGLRTVIGWRGQPIKFEIVREARIALSGSIDAALSVPVLSRTDQFAEKLLANADRCLDRATGYRDAIDLGFLACGTGGMIPPEAVAKTTKAYGPDVARKALRVIEILGCRESELRYAARTLAMGVDEATRAVAEFRKAAATAWPDLSFPEFGGSGDDPRQPSDD